MLTNKTLDAAKPQTNPYKLTDGHGLYVTITPTGIKSWRCNYKSDGKNKTHTFGRYPNISIAQARKLNFEFKDSEVVNKKIPTFDVIKKEWYLYRLPKLRSVKHKQQVVYRLDTFVSPEVGDMPIDTIKRADLVRVVKKIQLGGIIETAHRVGTHVRQVFDYAVDAGYIETHSANGLSRVLDTPKTKHMNCIDVNDAGKLFSAIDNYDEPITRLGLLLAAVTFVRTNELRGMQWSEIKDGRFWVIPSDRMKMKTPHVVPLSDYALSLLKELDEFNGDRAYVFNSPKRPNSPISENTLLFALYRMGYRGLMTVHGFRALASTVLNEQSSFGRDVIERQLAHKETDAVRAAYNRAEYLAERIKLMDWWSRWVTDALASYAAK